MARTFLAVGALAGLVATLGLAGMAALSGCGNGDDDDNSADSGGSGGHTSSDASADATTPTKDGGGTSDATTSGDGGPGTTDGATDGAAGNDARSGTGDDSGEDGGDAAPDAGPLAKVHFYGRFDTTDAPGTADAPIFDWSGSAIVADFTGTGIAVNLTNNPYFGPGVNEMQVVVDGTPAANAIVLDGSNGGVYTLASALTNKQHHLELYKRTEAYYGIVQFNGFSAEAPSDATWALVPTPDAVTRRLEFIGDSITAGYGVLGPDATCMDDGDYNDFYQAYGSDVARALGASALGIAYSGKGVYRDRNGNTTASDPSDPEMPGQYPRAVENLSGSVYDFSTQVDAVVINLGTNDFYMGDPGQPFIDAYKALIKSVRGHYPKAYILLVDGPLLTEFYPFTDAYDVLDTYLKTIVPDFAATDTNMGIVQVGIEPDCTVEANIDMCGCQDHPNVAEDSMVAATITTALRAALHW